MNSTAKRIFDSRTVTLAIVVSFCATSGLSIYSGDQIGMTLGSPSTTLIERASHFLMIAFQLWLYPLYWLCERFQIFGLHESIASSLVTAAFSAAILFPLVRLVSRH